MTPPRTRSRIWLTLAALASFTVGAAVIDRWTVQASSIVPKLTWFGQACFLMETPQGTRVLMDPTSTAATQPLPESIAADLVTVSHEHGDHNNIKLAFGTPKVLRGLTPDKKGWMKINEKYRDLSVRTIGVYHDDELGRERGLNSIFVFEVAGMRIAHLGDLGHTLTDRQLSDLGQVDVVLVPVGGTFTIDAERAARVVDQIRPRLIVVPMHYATKGSTNKDLASVDAFIAGRPHVRRVDSNTLVLNAIKKRPGAEVVVMNYN
ncbi:MAG: MBL fold metallo-hydrolase [Deltaproteobacteria bacterium]|nr:MBL fold metallo-hydrolase [Deltaproteobacteria bacterium]